MLIDDVEGLVQDVAVCRVVQASQAAYAGSDGGQALGSKAVCGGGR